MIRLSSGLLLVSFASVAHAQIDSLDREPINYKTAPTDNAITALQQSIDGGKTKLGFVDDHGYLPAILKELNVPAIIAGAGLLENQFSARADHAEDTAGPLLQR